MQVQGIASGKTHLGQQAEQASVNASETKESSGSDASESSLYSDRIGGQLEQPSPSVFEGINALAGIGETLNQSA